jgi:epoxyqueuosine reductase
MKGTLTPLAIRLTKENLTYMDVALFRQKLMDAGACDVGIGDLTNLPHEVRQGMPIGVSIAVALDLSVINGLGAGVTHAHVTEYRRANILLDQLATLGANLLAESGASAIPLTRSQVKLSYRDHGAILPHKTVATRAGMGWIGKNAMLVTKGRGSAIRITSILTDADWPTAIPYDDSLCGDCDACVRNCPGQAPLGPNWSVTSKREDFFDVLSCRKFCIESSWRVVPGESLCSLCVLACPWTKKAIEEEGLDYDFPAAQMANKGDLEEILALQKLSFTKESERLQDFTIAPMQQTLESITNEFTDPRKAMIFLKIVQDRRIVGSVRAYDKDGTCYIGRLVIHPDYQRIGLGKRLMQAIETCYRGARFELFTALHNPGNVRFYENLGYRTYDTRKLTDKIQLVYMEKCDDLSHP